MKNGKVQILVKRIKIPTDPSIEVFSVEVRDEKSSWMETVPTEETLHWFLRGIQAGASMFAKEYVSLPEVPKHSVLLNNKDPES